jgi:hypothetical protein
MKPSLTLAEGVEVADAEGLRAVLTTILPDEPTDPAACSVVLREAAAGLHEDSVRVIPERDAAYVNTVPTTDGQSAYDALAEVLMGVWSTRVWFRFHDYALYHDRLGEYPPDTWHIHHIGTEAYIDTLNVAAFESVVTFEAWLLDLRAAGPTTATEWRDAHRP